MGYRFVIAVSKTISNPDTICMLLTPTPKRFFNSVIMRVLKNHVVNIVLELFFFKIFPMLICN
jgi:hypothetical protein